MLIWLPSSHTHFIDGRKECRMPNEGSTYLDNIQACTHTPSTWLESRAIFLGKFRVSMWLSLTHESCLMHTITGLTQVSDGSEHPHLPIKRMICLLTHWFLPHLLEGIGLCYTHLYTTQLPSADNRLYTRNISLQEIYLHGREYIYNHRPDRTQVTMCSAIARVCISCRRNVIAAEGWDYCQEGVIADEFGYHCANFRWRMSKPAPGTENGCWKCTRSRLWRL